MRHTALSDTGRAPLPPGGGTHPDGGVLLPDLDVLRSGERGLRRERVDGGAAVAPAPRRPAPPPGGGGGPAALLLVLLVHVAVQHLLHTRELVRVQRLQNKDFACNENLTCRVLPALDDALRSFRFGILVIPSHFCLSLWVCVLRSVCVCAVKK